MTIYLRCTLGNAVENLALPTLGGIIMEGWPPINDHWRGHQLGGKSLNKINSLSYLPKCYNFDNNAKLAKDTGNGRTFIL